MSLLIRTAGMDDLAALAAIEQACSGMPWSKGQIAEELENACSLNLAAELDGEVVGFASLQIAADDAHLNECGVLPAYRCRGIGRALLDAAFAECAKRDCAVFSLEVRVNNAPARALYAHYGLEQVGVRKNFYKNPPDDALVLLKLLKEAKPLC